MKIDTGIDGRQSERFVNRNPIQKRGILKLKIEN